MSDESHVAILYENMFKNAKRIFCILCHNLNGKVFDDQNVCKSVKNFLDAKKKLYIAVEDEPKELTKFLKIILNEKYDGQVFFWTGKKVLGKNNRKLNFAVMDDTAYRFVPDQKNGHAYFSANDPVFARKLLRTFQEVISDNSKTGMVSEQEGSTFQEVISNNSKTEISTT